MPADQKTLLLEKSYAECVRNALCEKYGVSVSTLKRRIDEAREAFRKIWRSEQRK